MFIVREYAVVNTVISLDAIVGVVQLKSERFDGE